ncbi:endonuclease/exonuclease/phosphatase family protein [Colwellia sp. C1TZA3]|uniref:endonuclease/exonuclease/phosphatase family protein n=1 Tax=Colwellia sp. C1TZA3 TaxID=2508879 RepID=UPI0011BA12B3|nr:endonuclease/exonuclease/phosphatase family protein [Colwellia sp. C1TZA3]TWX71382.1 endonuclease/exonuclease/phosphatase family protein [Colwellia sp. C1TZA3]
MIKGRYSKVESLKIMGHAAKQMLGPNIEILMWNVFKCRKKGWQDDFITLMRDKNLILLQEAIINSPFDSHFKASLQHQWIMARSFKNIRTNIETGVKTGSTVAAQTHYCSASEHSEPISKTKKMLLASVYPLHTFGQSLLVVNAHIINFVTFQKFKTHLDQVFQTLEHHDGPILIAGDFNTWNSKRLKYFNQLTTLFSLEEVKMNRQPRLKHLFQHLDHIYCRGLMVVDAHVHTHIHSSDHYPISLSLQAVKPTTVK